MAFFQLFLQARNLEEARLRYENEKLMSIELWESGAKPEYTWKQRIRRQKILLKRKLYKFLKKVFALRKGSWMYKKVVLIRTEGTLENFIAKSFFGFVSGILLTYMFFVFFVFQLNFKLSSATAICTIIGVILTLGLAFSYQVRCVVLLLLPQFFSKRGRQALMAYAFILALTGPVKNILHNTGVLTESLACAQEQLKEAVKTVIDLIKQPFYALRDAISKVIKSIKAVVKRIRRTLIAIKRIVLSILKVITAVFQWLGSIINICNKKLGTPFDRCQGVFEGAVADCKAKLGPYFGVVCNITYVVSTLCYIVKPLDFICMLVSYVADTVVGAVRRKIKKFTMHMKAMFYVNVKFSHSFHFETNQSKTVQEVASSIATEIRSRTDGLFGFVDWMSFVTSFLTFFIVLRVMRYRHKWLTSERFDNRYITNDLRTIDLIRARQQKETVLPLNRREKNRYVSLSSVLLIKSERMKLARSMVFLGLATIKLAAYMAIDYSLYWVLNTIQIYGRYQSKVEEPSVVNIHVAGEGYLSDVYRSVVKSFAPPEKDTEIDTMVCLPAPVTPDLDKYTQIIMLTALCWLMMFLEPYGLRLRQVVMCQYYPDRAKQRAAWLYNHIIRSRGSFLKFARRQLRRKFGLTEGEKTERVTLKERLWATLPCLRILFPFKQNACLLCGSVERDDNLHIKCRTPGCIGLFCTQCFADLQNLCTICRNPVEYGDLSDMSEEKDSSDDQLPVIKVEPPKPEDQGEPPFEEEEETVEGEEEYEYEEEETMEGEEEYDDEEEEEETEEPKGEEEETEEQEEEERTEVETEEEKVGDEDTVEKGKKVKMEDAVEKEKKMKTKDAVVEEKKVKMEDVTEEEEVEKEVALQTDAKDEDADWSSETSYSYTYQDESPEEVEMARHREPFRDLEAQKIRDDVTIQIFNEPSIKDTSSSWESRRNVRARLKKRAGLSIHRDKDSDSSSSIADTESWPTEEVDEEEVIHIEMDGSSDELLPKDRKDKEKRGRINKIVSAVARIPWLGKGEDDKKGTGSRSKGPSLMNRIGSMLRRSQSKPVQTYRRSRKTKDSSSSSSSDDETETLLSSRDDRHLTRRRVKRTSDSDEVNLNLRHPREKGFTTKRLPRYLESTAESTSYFEVDETEDSRAARKCVRRVEDINELSSKASFAARKRDGWNITEDDELGPCTCTSETSYGGIRDREVFEMTTISEQTDDAEMTIKETESEDTTTISESETDYSDDTESVIVSRKPEVVKEGVKGTKIKKKTISMKESLKGDMEKSPKEIVEILKDTDDFQTYDPLAGLELYGVSYKSKRKPVSRRQEISVENKIEITDAAIENIQEEDTENEEESKWDDSNEKKFKNDTSEEDLTENDRNEGHLKKNDTNQNESKENDTSVKESKNNGANTKHLKRNDANVETEQTAKIKIDKSTDLPDRSRSTQTKLHSGDKGAKSKHVQTVSKVPNTKDSRRVSKESTKKFHFGGAGSKELIMESRPEESIKNDKKRKLRERYKEHSVGTDDSKRRKHLEKSTATDEGLYSLQMKDGKHEEHREGSENWESHGNAYSPYDSHTLGTNRRYAEEYRNVGESYGTRPVPRKIPHSEMLEFKMPVVKKYLPMYQSPELIEELKRHDRLRLIREREAEQRGASSPRSISTSSRMRAGKSVRSIVPDHSTPSKVIKEEDTLPYQETQAYKNVLREFRRRTNQRKTEKDSDSIPLMHLSKRADKSKQVELLYPPRDQRSGAVRKFAKRMIASLKAAPRDKRRQKTVARSTYKKKGAICRECSFEPEIVTETSSVCSEKTEKSDALISTDETTDNNESS